MTLVSRSMGRETMVEMKPCGVSCLKHGEHAQNVKAGRSMLGLACFSCPMLPRISIELKWNPIWSSKWLSALLLLLPWAQYIVYKKNTWFRQILPPPPWSRPLHKILNSKNIHTEMTKKDMSSSYIKWIQSRPRCGEVVFDDNGQRRRRLW